MKRFYLSLLLCAIGSLAIAQELQLENTANGRSLTLKPGSTIDLHLELPAAQMVRTNNRVLTGALQAPEKGLLQILPVEETKQYIFENGLQREDKTYYEELLGRQPYRLPLEEVHLICYRTPAVERLNKAGKALMAAGAAGALLVAPLASIDYGEGSFNSDRYFRITGYSLITAGVGVAVKLSTRKRNFAILQPGESPDKNRWTLKILN
ncbi:MAG: hypothetical protein RIC19_22050 [Phaeodactylibacter sp.]|uniref:hypothetical protein n=1 Tax=Phaeodactylibacter sp. TaxID=1940289 RepID=UPI0032EB1A84